MRPAGAADRLLDDVRVREVEEQRHEIGEPFVERRHVDVGRDEKHRPQAVEQRVRGLVHDDVVAQGRADQTLPHHESGRVGTGVEIAERQIAALAAVAGIAAAKAERPDDQPQRTVGGHGGRPGDVAAERAPEGRVGQAADGIDHLQMKVAVQRRRREAARQQQVGIVEIERRRRRSATGRRRRPLETALRSGRARASRTAPSRWPLRRAGPTPTGRACRCAEAETAARRRRARKGGPTLGARRARSIRTAARAG